MEEFLAQESKIITLYNEEFSGPQIALKLNIGLKKVYKTLLKQGTKRRSAIHQSEIRFRNSPLSYNFNESTSPKEERLLIAAIMLYYGEGAKTGTTVDFANSDQKALALFLKFLRQICRVNESKLRFYLYCFENQDPNQLINFWCSTLNIKRENFTKPYIRKIKKSNKRIMSWGVLHIRYNDKRLLEKILSLISSVTNQLLFENWAGSEVAKRGRLSMAA